MYTLETAENLEQLKRVVIEPLTRVEGHGKVTLLLDEDNHIQQARLHIVEFRGFEKFIQGRPYWELPVLVQRLCGICPVSHHLAAEGLANLSLGGKKPLSNHGDGDDCGELCNLVAFTTSFPKKARNAKR